MKKLTIGIGAIAVALSMSGGASAQNVTMTGASCFPKNYYFSFPFEKMVPEINAANTGVTVNYVGGAPAIGSPFTLVQQTSKGVYGLVSCTGAYYQNVLPEADVFKLVEYSHEELRERGAFDYIDKLHQEKGLKYLAKIIGYTPFHLYLNKKIDKPDLTGLHLRVAPIYTAFFQALGATTQQSNFAQVYSYMENGTVVGYGWPVTGLAPDWHKVTKYRVDPGFYDTDINVMMNLDTWNKLGDDQKKSVTDISLKYERDARNFEKDVATARAKQAEQGIETITFTGADADKWLKTAREAGWANLMKNSPEHGAKLRELFAKN